MGLGDALHDGQPEAHAGVVGMDPFGSALERLDQGGDQFRPQVVAGVLDREHHGVGERPGGGPDRAPLGHVVDDGVVDQVRRHLQQEGLRAPGRGRAAAGLDGDASPLGQRKERFRRCFDEEGQVDGSGSERSLVGPAQEQQRLGEVDGPGVHRVQAFEQRVGVPVRVVAGHLEQGLGDGQRGAQLVGGVGGESLLLGHVGLETAEHGVEVVGQVTELVPPARQPYPVGEHAGGGDPGSIGDAAQRGQHAPGQEPAPEQPDDQEHGQRHGRRREQVDQQAAAAGSSVRASHRGAGRRTRAGGCSAGGRTPRPPAAGPPRDRPGSRRN